MSDRYDVASRELLYIASDTLRAGDDRRKLVLAALHRARAAGRDEMRAELISFLRDEGERLFEADDDERAEVIGWVLECVSAIGTKPKEP